MGTLQENTIPSISASLDVEEVDFAPPVIQCNVGGGVKLCFGRRVLKCINFYFLHSSCFLVKCLELSAMFFVKTERIFGISHRMNPEKVFNPLEEHWTHLSPIIIIFILAYTFSNKTYHLVRQSPVDVLFSVYAISVNIRAIFVLFSSRDNFSMFKFTFEVLACGVIITPIFIFDVVSAVRFKRKATKALIRSRTKRTLQEIKCNDQHEVNASNS